MKNYLNVEIDEELREQFKIKCLQDKTNMKSKVTEMIKSYLPFFKKDPRRFFLPDWKEGVRELSWTSNVLKFPYRYSFGWIETPYNPITPILNEEKFKPVNWIFLHKFTSWRKKYGKKQNTCLLSIHGYAEFTFRYHEQSYFHIFKNVRKNPSPKEKIFA